MMASCLRRRAQAFRFPALPTKLYDYFHAIKQEKNLLYKDLMVYNEGINHSFEHYLKGFES